MDREEVSCMEQNMERLDRVMMGVTVVLVVWLVSSYVILPLSVEHGYFVTAAKLMVQGYVPGKDFMLEDSPFGIGLLGMLYHIVGIDASSYWASWIILCFHLLNVWLLGKLLKHLLADVAGRWLGMAFYVAVLFSSDAFLLNMEPVAMSFVLGGLNLLAMNRTDTRRYIAAGMMLAFGVFCKTQSLVLLPLVCWVLDRRLFRYFISSFVVSMFVFYIGVGWACGDFTWPMYIEWKGWKDAEASSILSVLANLVIFTARCSLFFLLLYFIVRKDLNEKERAAVCMGVSAYVLVCLLLALKSEMAYTMMAYPFIAMAGVVLIRKMKKYRPVMVLAMFSIPSVLAAREFGKLDWGNVKESQQEELEVIRMAVEDCDNALLICDDCYEFQLGPQVFAEIPHLKPVNLGFPKIGLEDAVYGYKDIREVVNAADCIIVGQLSLKSIFSTELHAMDDVVDYMENIGTASFTILKRTDDTPEL